MIGRDGKMNRRGFLRTAGASALLAGTGSALSPACSLVESDGEDFGGGTLAQARRQGYIEVGFANESPYGFIDKTGQFTGAAPALAGEIFRALGVTDIKEVRLDFGQLIGGLIARRYDAIAASMSITPERCASIAFAEPDYCAKTAFLVPMENPYRLKTFEDVADNPGLRLGVVTGAVEVGQAKAAGVRESQLAPYADQPSAFEGLKAERVDAIALTRISLAALLGNYENAPYRVTPPFSPTVDGRTSVGCGAFAFRKQDVDLVRAWNRELARLRDSRQLLKIIQPYGFTEDELPGKHTAAEFCDPRTAAPVPSASPG